MNVRSMHVHFTRTYISFLTFQRPLHTGRSSCNNVSPRIDDVGVSGKPWRVLVAWQTWPQPSFESAASIPAHHSLSGEQRLCPS